jgi:integral membrane sensor domain MASE1
MIPMHKEDKTEALLASVAALLVLFTAIINPLTSAIISIVLIVLFAIYKFAKK